MLDKLILKYLTKQGKVFYWVGQIVLLLGLFYYLFEIENNSWNDDGELTFILYAIVIVLGWAGICLLFFRKKAEKPTDDSIVK